MDLGKYMTAHGIKSVYQDDDFGTMLMEVAPEEFTNADLGVFQDSSAEHMRKLQKMEDMAQAMLQNNAKPSTMMEIMDTINAVELKAKLKRIEAIEQEIAQQQAESEQEAQKDLEEIAQRHEAYLKLLERENMNAEYDRKEDLVYIEKGLDAANQPVEEVEGTDPIDLAKLDLERTKVQADIADKSAQREERNRKLQLDMIALQHQVSVDNKKLEQGDKKLVIDRKKAAQRPKATTKK
jgi:hypothetical protein